MATGAESCSGLWRIFRIWVWHLDYDSYKGLELSYNNKHFFTHSCILITHFSHTLVYISQYLSLQTKNLLKPYFWQYFWNWLALVWFSFCSSTDPNWPCQGGQFDTPHSPNNSPILLNTPVIRSIGSQEYYDLAVSGVIIIGMFSK